MRALGPEDRELFEGSAAPLFEAVLAADGLPDEDPRLLEGSPERRAFELLVDLGLMVHDKTTRRWYGVDPATVQSAVVTPLTTSGARLLTESSEWANAFTSLAQAWRRSPGTAKGPITEVRGEAINPFLASVVADAEFELITAQPQAGRAGATLEPVIRAAAERDIAALERGVRMRTLYQHAARRSTITRKYVAEVTPHGAEVRTLDEFFNRLIVVDRRIAVIPSHEGLSAALAIRDTSLVAYLVDMFERSWERARPFTNRETSLMKDIAAEQRAMTIRMLIEGHADPASAKRLGVSPRTYAGYVADLKTEYDAQTRFQLGYEMGRRGLDGRNAHED